MVSPVPVVKLIIPDKEGKILILKRSRTGYSEGLWCLPGGKIDYGETIEQTISKELLEKFSTQLESPNGEGEEIIASQE